jgi:predicted AAA+ superfamily ATPase
MKRSVFKYLESWSHRAQRKPLLLRGARQVGKTWLVRELAKNFENFVEYNLESQPETHEYFVKFFGEPTKLIKYLAADSGQPIVTGRTLLFLDEIQECPEAILSLRYFKEKMPDLHVIAAGSLIEFALRELSFPVGRIESLYIFPLNFFEYLSAIGEEALLDILDGANTLPNALHCRVLEELRTYMLIGGLPEVVATYAVARDLNETQRILQQLTINFRSDFAKYAKYSKLSHLRRVFDQAPSQFGKKLVYANIANDIRARELSEAIDLLQLAGIVIKCHHSSGNGVPLSAEIVEKKFKLFFVDIGLACRVMGSRLSKELILNPEDIINRGGLAEQFIAQELLATNSNDETPALYYWHREERGALAEVDFLLEKDNEVIPIEVKSGTSSKSKSLRVFLSEKQHVGRAYRLSLENKISPKDSVIKQVPLYLASLLKIL